MVNPKKIFGTVPPDRVLHRPDVSCGYLNTKRSGSEMSSRGSLRMRKNAAAGNFSLQAESGAIQIRTARAAILSASSPRTGPMADRGTRERTDFPCQAGFKSRTMPRFDNLMRLGVSGMKVFPLLLMFLTAVSLPAFAFDLSSPAGHWLTTR